MRWWFLIAPIALVAVGACSSPSPPPSTPRIQLVTAASGVAAVDVVGLSRRELDAVSKANLTPADWPALLRVSVRHDPVAVAGRYAVTAGALRFTPLFDFDPGREYDVVFDPARLPGTDRGRDRVSAVVSLPAVVRAASTIVDAVYPSGDVVPENQLRLYVHFSAPMGQRGGAGFITLVDDRGRELADALLPLDTDLWNDDRTRFTVFFDPGRVKRGILPNRRMGRPLRAGRSFTLVVSKDWPDAHGVPLALEFRRTYRVRSADERALRTADWRVTPPAAGGREPLVVMFPTPLDHALLERAIGVAKAGVAVAGSLRIESGETRWMFVPADPWTPGNYTLQVLPILEDLAGNRIGRAFEEPSDGAVTESGDKQVIAVPFRIGGR